MTTLTTVLYPELEPVVNELTEALTEAGLLPIAALDIAETIATDERLAKRLRWLTGDVVLAQHFRDRGLRDSES